MTGMLHPDAHPAASDTAPPFGTNAPRQPGGSDVSLPAEVSPGRFAADLPEAPTRVMAVEQRPVAQAGFAQNATKAAWKTIPSWFIVARNDKAIAPDLERFEAKRAKSHTIEINSSHVAMMSHPGVVTDQIRQAAHTTVGSAK
ncbi:alpha/beta fold hydrolase [Streptomyces uncialis]|uniref:alpha/beta fold hydrolase n=1 Tax=Streptomyces uncialis TaxID=1048205 RepID=UPI00364FC7C6